MTLVAGTRLGPYEIIAAIGVGGMGEVYRERDTTLHRDVAIKVLPAAMASDSERLARFKREAQVLASLNHSNIAHVYGFEESVPSTSSGTATAGTPEPIQRLLRRCLEKDRRERLADMGAARLEIKDALSGATEAAVRDVAIGPRKRRLFGLTRASAGLAVLCAALAIALALALSLSMRPAAKTADPGVIRFPLISDRGIRVSGATQPFAISRDGNTIIFSGSDSGRTQLWVRTLDEPEPRVIADTENGAAPAISPDGEWVAFVSANQVIRKVRIRGGGGPPTSPPSAMRASRSRGDSTTTSSSSRSARPRASTG